MPLVYTVITEIGGQVRLLESSLVPEKDAGGAVTHIVGVVTDRTEEAALREELVLSRTVQDEMATFLSMAAQDLATPMSLVRNLTDGLRDGFQDLGDGKLQAIDALEQIAAGSLKLISDMMDDVNVEHAVIERSVVHLRRVVNDALLVVDPEDRHHVTCAELKVDVDETVFQIILREVLDARLSQLDDTRQFVQVDAAAHDEDWLRVAISSASDGAVPGVELEGYTRARRLVEARGGLLQFQEKPGGPHVISFTLPAGLIGAPAMDNQA